VLYNETHRSDEVRPVVLLDTANTVPERPCAVIWSGNNPPQI